MDLNAICAALPGVDAEFDFSFRINTTVGIGGTAPLALYPREGQWEKCLKVLCGTPYFVMGRGSNLLASDAGYDGVVLRTDRSCALRAEGHTLYASCGASIAKTLAFAARNGMCGLEFLAGIPASIGGAVFMNAGAQGHCIGERILSVVAFEGGKAITLPRSECGFGYRSSRFSESGGVILAVRFKMERCEPSQAFALVSRALAARRHLPKGKSLGCVFKNPPCGVSAGAIIERAGLKGAAAGGAFVSHEHANFILNRGDATANDYISLVNYVREKTFERTGIRLREEIRTIGEI